LRETEKHPVAFVYSANNEKNTVFIVFFFDKSVVNVYILCQKLTVEHS